MLLNGSGQITKMCHKPSSYKWVPRADQFLLLGRQKERDELGLRYSEFMLSVPVVLQGQRTFNINRYQSQHSNMQLTETSGNNILAYGCAESITFAKFSSILVLASSISVTLFWNATSTASHCSRMSRDVSCRMLSMSCRSCMEAILSCSARTMLS